MHAVMIAFTSSAPLEDLQQPFERYAQALTAVPGLIMTSWIADQSTIDGFHIFDDSAHTHAYLGGELCATVLHNPSFTNFDVRHFDVIEDLSAITRSPLAHEAA